MKHNVFEQNIVLEIKIIYSDEAKLVYKSHENDYAWSLGSCNSKRHNKKWIIKNIRGHHTCLAQHRQLDKHIK